MTYTQMIFALIFDRLIFGHNPTLTSMAGSIMIVTSALYIAVQKQAAKQRADEDKTKEREMTNGNLHMRQLNYPRTRSHDEERGFMQEADDDEEATEGAKEMNGHSRPRSRRASMR